MATTRSSRTSPVTLPLSPPAMVTRTPSSCAARRWTSEVIDAFGDLKVVIRAGAGFNTIDTQHARRRAIDVMNTPGANSNAVAEEVVALMLADCRHIIPADASTRAGKWEKKKFTGRELAEKTVGIVGLGKRWQARGQETVRFRRQSAGLRPGDFEASAPAIWTWNSATSQHSSPDPISSPFTFRRTTRRGAWSMRISSVSTRQGAAIVNCARSGIVDEAALRQAKKEKRSALPQRCLSAGRGRGQNRLPTSPTSCSPISAPAPREANYNAARRAAEQLIDFETKGVTSFIVNRDIPEGLDENLL